MKKLFAFALIGAALCTGCTTCTDCCDDCEIKTESAPAPQVKYLQDMLKTPAPAAPRAVVVRAMAPKCVVKSEFWGRKYLELTDVNGVVYKVTPPSAGITVRFVGKTGWYELTNGGKIIRWKDPR